jgi:hypothetical protein
MPFVFVQAASAHTNFILAGVSSQAVTFPSPTTAGNLIVVCVVAYEQNNSGGVTAFMGTPTDDASNGYQQWQFSAQNTNNNTYSLGMRAYYHANSASANTITVAATGGNKFQAAVIFAAEFSGAGSGLSLDVGQTGGNVLTPTNLHELVCQCSASGLSAGMTSAATAGWTGAATYNPTYSFGYLLNSSGSVTGTQNPPSVALVQSKTGSTTSTAFTSSVTAGNFIVVELSCTGASATISGNSNTYNLVTNYIGDIGHHYLFYAWNVNSGTTTIVVSGATTMQQINMWEFSGIQLSADPKDQVGTQGGAITPSGNGYLVFNWSDWIDFNGTSFTMTANSPWTLAPSTFGGTSGSFFCRNVAAWEVQSAAASILSPPAGAYNNTDSANVGVDDSFNVSFIPGPNTNLNVMQSFIARNPVVLAGIPPFFIARKG